MSQSLEALRRQIDTVTDLGSVVTTMKTLAAVSIHQYEQAVTALRDYSRTIEMGFQILLRDELLPVELADDGRTAALVFGSDQGMCGQFNESIVELFNEQARQAKPRLPWIVSAIGHRAEGQLLESGWSVDQTYGVPTSVSDISNLVFEMLPEIEALRHQKGISRLLVFYNRRESASKYSPQVVQFLPISNDEVQRWRETPWDSRSLPIFATDRRRLMSRLIGQYLFVSLYRACAESLASENASRIAAMQAAEKNIEERLAELQSSFNHQRQTAITEELLDVVTGFEALSERRDLR